MTSPPVLRYHAPMDAPAPPLPTPPVTLEGTHLPAATTLPIADQLQELLSQALLDTLHTINFRAHLEMLARTEPRTFMQYVALCLPKIQQRGGTPVQINNFANAIPKGPLDSLPPGFDLHR